MDEVTASSAAAGPALGVDLTVSESLAASASASSFAASLPEFLDPLAGRIKLEMVEISFHIFS